MHLGCVKTLLPLCMEFLSEEGCNLNVAQSAQMPHTPLLPVTHTHTHTQIYFKYVLADGFHFAPPADVTKQCWLRNFAALAFLAHCIVEEWQHVRYDDDDTLSDYEPVHLILRLGLPQ